MSKNIFPNFWKVLTLTLASFTANAHDITLKWTRPTTYTNGAVMPLTDIAFYRIDVGSCAGTNVFGTRKAVAYPGASLTTFTLTGFATGTYCARMYTKTKAGVLSNPTGVVSITFTATQVLPSPPSGVTVTGVLR